jgi:hypothetical protein
MAGLLGSLKAWRSTQLYEALSLPPWNQALSPPARVPDFVLWKSLSHERSSRALSAQKFSGSSMDFLYSCLYSSRFARWGLPCLLELWLACDSQRELFGCACDHLLKESFRDLVSRHRGGFGNAAVGWCLLLRHDCGGRSRACRCME